jgi:hypothetical protein
LKIELQASANGVTTPIRCSINPTVFNPIGTCRNINKNIVSMPLANNPANTPKLNNATIAASFGVARTRRKYSNNTAIGGTNPQTTVEKSVENSSSPPAIGCNVGSSVSKVILNQNIRTLERWHVSKKPEKYSCIPQVFSYIRVINRD